MERRTEERNTGTLTGRLTALVTARDGLTDPWRELGERAFADTVGALVAGAGDPAVTALTAALDEGDGPVRSVATGARLSPRSAALLDGTAAHALDYDDVDDALIAHPSAVLVPALLAGGARSDATGDALLDAFRVGVEAGRAVATALGARAHYELGWHATATVGTLSAAAALARLDGLEPDAVRRALGVAGSLAAGSRQNFGTETKPLHAGVAASNGVLAARLAGNGFTADRDQLDGPIGFLALHASPAAGAVHVPTPPGEAPPGLNVKLYPCCYYVHAAAEAAIELSTQVCGPVERIEVTVQPGGLAPLIHSRPSDGTQAKFSMEYTVAACLIDGALTSHSFTPDAVARPEVRELLARVRAREEPAGGGSFAEVVVHHGGARTAVRVDHPDGHATRPVSRERLRAKFVDCVRDADPAAAHRAWDALSGLRREASVRALVEDLIMLRSPHPAGSAGVRPPGPHRIREAS